MSLAASLGNVSVLRLLLSAGANPNSKGSRELPIVLAVMSRSSDALRVLLAAGADVNGDGGEALAFAAQRTYAAEVRLLLQAGAVPRDEYTASLIDDCTGRRYIGPVGFGANRTNRKALASMSASARVKAWLAMMFGPSARI